MPATRIVVLASGNLRASRIRSAATDLPVECLETADPGSLSRLLRERPFSVAILPTSIGWEELSAIADANPSAFVVVGDSLPWLGCWELGATALVESRWPIERWRGLLTRLVEQSQERQRSTG